MSKVLEFHSVHFTFEKRKIAALDNISFEVLSQQTFVLMGPSGTGKSTLLSLITGKRAPHAGSVELAISQDDIGHFAPIESHQYSQSLQEILLSKLRHLGDKEAHAEIHTMIDLVGLQYKETRPLSELSQGQLTRAMMACALILKPKLLLLDEPLAHLDPVLKREMIAEYKALKETFNLSALWITHDPDEALMVGDSLAYLDHGTLKQIGEPQDFLYHPASLEIARFFGPLNVFVVNQKEGEGALATSFAEFNIDPERLAHYSPQFLVGVRPGSIILDENASLRAKVQRIWYERSATIVEVVGIDKNPIRIQCFKAPATREVSFRIKWSEALLFKL